ncbi:gamma-glutamylcyclotransferase family protein [Nocardioides sp. B-3]|uniref:gamma-glutamylcyclotransferase family protein n=1 Tax=Nocardioides sp. B-3 TaxID=2895565 RepID=UPI0021533304|nr:gamma-glutamylcyclotransferase family protein [Nocardioides sp. B-3]UUZ57954.1 gamma-glutamylcyclotransferase [Nocardioides sp. B-3]
MIQRLFVYGTLAPGRPNEHVLEDIEGHWESATVRGRLVEEGWGFEHGYAALELDDDAAEVAGLLFVSEHLEEHWARLDEFEGVGYERVSVRAVGDDGPVEAHVYVNRETIHSE